MKGGPGSFQERFEKCLRNLGWRIVYPDVKSIPDAIIVNGSTSHILWLLKAKLNGTVIIYRLGGINWLYKYKSETSVIQKVFISLKCKLIPLVQKLFADSIIYQSDFSKTWLLKLGQSANLKNNSIIYNGVDINVFKPAHSITRVRAKETISLICVEGNLDYSPYAIDLINFLYNHLVEKGILNEIRLYGDFEYQVSRQKLHPSVKYFGLIPKIDVHKVYQNAIYLSLDINPGCPNAVLEALASGLPIVGYNTGSLAELVPELAGIIVPFGGDPWKLDLPDFYALGDAIEKVLNNYDVYSQNARKVAMEKFSVEEMAAKYMEVILGLISSRRQ
jgi:glycosyltransferase involved in cell wall biosynthesis